jgi:Rhomboid-like protein
MGFPRRRPGTVCYLAVLLASHLVVFHLLPEQARGRVLRGIGTNLSAMGWSAPLRLVASALVVDTSGGILNIALIVFFGIVVSLGRLEDRLGGARAFGIFGAAHVLASLLVLTVVAAAIRTGRYPSEVAHELDYGVSYGALGAIGAMTWLVPRWVRPFWAVAALFYPLTAADWYGWLPDYSTVGHVLSAATGVGLGVLAVRYGRAPVGEPAQGLSAGR